MDTFHSYNPEISQEQPLSQSQKDTPDHTSIPVNVDELYYNINQLIHSVTNKQQSEVVTQESPVNYVMDITFDEDPIQLKMKVKTLEIEVAVQKGRIDQLNEEKIRLYRDIDDLKAEMGLNTNMNMSINKSETANNQHILIGEIQRLRADIERNAYCNDGVKQREYQSTIKSLTIEIQRLMVLNQHRNNVEYVNQTMRGEIHKLGEINRMLGQQNLMLKNNINNYSQQRVQLYQYVEISKELENRNRTLQSYCEQLQQQLHQVNQLRGSEERVRLSLGNRPVHLERENARCLSINKRELSPVMNESRKRTTNRSVSRQNDLRNIMSPSNSSKVDSGKWNKLQQRINTLKQQNEQLKKSIYSK